MDLDSFGARARLSVGDRSYDVFRLDAVVDDPRRLPFSIRVLVENLLRREDGVGVTADDIHAIADRSRSAQEAGSREPFVQELLNASLWPDQPLGRHSAWAAGAVLSLFFSRPGTRYSGRSRGRLSG